MPLCKFTQKNFSLSSLEVELRQEFHVGDPDCLQPFRMRHLGAFWPHWALHKRKCDSTGRDIVSVFRDDCPYPVWHQDVWRQKAQPPKANFDFSRPFFVQAEKLFKQCPIPHTNGMNNENCEYTDDWWDSKNCYLGHSGNKSEDLRYCYRDKYCRDCMFCDFSFHLERCFDSINCEQGYELVHCLYLKNSRECSFCYDCRGCSNCLFSFNLRNKQYCIGNKQLTKEQYEEAKKSWDFRTQEGYKKGKDFFMKMMKDIAWHRATYVDKCEGTTGNYVENSEQCEAAYFMKDAKKSVNITRGSNGLYSHCDTLGCSDAKNVYLSALIQGTCNTVFGSFVVNESSFVYYSAYCNHLQNGFGCCGLSRGENCIMNTAYSKNEYDIVSEKITQHMKSTGEWGQFFPASFAPNIYDESWSGFHFSLSPDDQKKYGFYFASSDEARTNQYSHVSEMPKIPDDANVETTKKIYWDEEVKRPFQIIGNDIILCKELGVALPNCYYIPRLQKNFGWMPYNGTLRTTKCAKSGEEIYTAWPMDYDGRILSESEYLKIVG